MINCCELLEGFGFNTVETRALDGSDVLKVTTPSTFFDGQPITFYLINFNGKIQLTDDSSTLFKFVKDGYEMKNRWKSIHSIIDKYGLNRSNGEIYINIDKSNLWQGFSKFFACISEIISYEKDLHIVSHTSDFVELVAKELEKRGPIERNPTIIGGSQKEYTFNFKQDDKYIDAISVHPASTGSEIRKLLDVRLAYPDLDVLLVLNDENQQQEKIDQEALILNNVASVINFTDLKYHQLH